MNKKLVLTLPLLSLSILLISQVNVILPSGGQIAADPYAFVRIPDSLLQYANEVVREESTVFKVESLRAGSMTYRRVVTILNDESHANLEVVYYDKDSRIRRFEANLYDARGRLIRKVDKDEIKDYSAVADFSIYQDDRRQVLEIRHSEYPYTVEIEYEMRLAGHQFCTYPSWIIQGFGTAMEKGELVLDMPAGLKFHYQVLNISLEPKKTEDKGREIYTWTVGNLKAPRSESYMPQRYKVLPMVMVSPDQFEWDRYQGSMANWQAFGKFMSSLFDGRDQLPEAAVQTIHRLVEDAGSDSEKVHRLYRYLQDNMRYVSVQLGIGGWQPFDATYVSEKRYGDCKALSNYMKSILAVAGIEAYPALIYNGDLRYEVQEDFTMPRFNHMILYVPGEKMWLECTSNNYPAGYIGYSNSNRNALLVTPEGGHLLKTPVYEAADNIESHRAQIDVDVSGQARLQVESDYAGADHEIFRSLKSYRSEEDQKKWLLEQQGNAGFKLEQYELNCDANQPNSRLRYGASISRFAQKAGKRLFVPLKPITPLVSIPPKNDNRLYPIQIQRAYTERDTVVLRFPEGFEVESAPELEEVIASSFGQYRRRITIEEGQVTFYREVNMQVAQLPAEAYEDYRNFYKEVAKADGAQLVLKFVE